MKKTEHEDIVYYTITWSDHYLYERIATGRVLPDMSGIVAFREKTSQGFSDLLMIACWREGMRSSVKSLFDPLLSWLPDTVKKISERELWYRYAVVDSTASDMRDVMFYLLKGYQPEFNNVSEYTDSKRYKEISVNEELTTKV